MKLLFGTYGLEDVVIDCVLFDSTGNNVVECATATLEPIN